MSASGAVRMTDQAIPGGSGGAIGQSIIGTGSPIVLTVLTGQIALFWWFSGIGDGSHEPAISVVEGDEPVVTVDSNQPVPFMETTWGGGTLTGNGQYEFSSAVTNFYLHVVVVNQG